MLSKACKSVIVIVCLCFLVNFDISAQMGIIGVEMGKFTENNNGIISLDLAEKNTNQLIFATLLDEHGTVIDLVKLDTTFSAKVKWKVKYGTYKVLLINAKTGEKEIHYALL